MPGLRAPEPGMVPSDVRPGWFARVGPGAGMGRRRPGGAFPSPSTRHPPRRRAASAGAGPGALVRWRGQDAITWPVVRGIGEHRERCVVDWPSIIAWGGVTAAIVELMPGIGRVVAWAAEGSGRPASLECQVKERERIARGG